MKRKHEMIDAIGFNRIKQNCVYISLFLPFILTILLNIGPIWGGSSVSVCSIRWIPILHLSRAPRCINRYLCDMHKKCDPKYDPPLGLQGLKRTKTNEFGRIYLEKNEFLNISRTYIWCHKSNNRRNHDSRQWAQPIGYASYSPSIIRTQIHWIDHGTGRVKTLHAHRNGKESANQNCITSGIWGANNETSVDCGRWNEMKLKCMGRFQDFRRLFFVGISNIGYKNRHSLTNNDEELSSIGDVHTTSWDEPIAPISRCEWDENAQDPWQWGVNSVFLDTHMQYIVHIFGKVNHENKVGPVSQALWKNKFFLPRYII